MGSSDPDELRRAKERERKQRYRQRLKESKELSESQSSNKVIATSSLSLNGTAKPQEVAREKERKRKEVYQAKVHSVANSLEINTADPDAVRREKERERKQKYRLRLKERRNVMLSESSQQSPVTPTPSSDHKNKVDCVLTFETPTAQKLTPQHKMVRANVKKRCSLSETIMIYSDEEIQRVSPSARTSTNSKSTKSTSSPESLLYNDAKRKLDFSCVF